MNKKIHIDIDMRVNFFLECRDKLSQPAMTSDELCFALINTSLWARKVSEYIHDYHKPIAKIKIPSANGDNESYFLRTVLNNFVHSIYINIDNGLLSITSDGEHIIVHYDDFLNALKILKIPPHDRVSIIYKKLRKILNPYNKNQKNYDTNYDTNTKLDFAWLLVNAIKNNLEIKRNIEKILDSVTLPPYSGSLGTPIALGIECGEIISYINVIQLQKIFDEIKKEIEKQKTIAVLLRQLELIASHQRRTISSTTPTSRNPHQNHLN